MSKIVGGGTGPVQMTISRAGKEQEVTIPRTRQCA